MHKKGIFTFLILLVVLSSCNLPGIPQPTSAPADAPAREPAAINLLLIEPSDGDSFPALTSVPVAVQVAGGAQNVELLIDGLPFQESQTPRLSNLARWSWASSEPGIHTLQVRAADGDGNVYISGSIRVWISENAARSTTLYSSQEGDTLNGLAERFNTTPQLLYDFNPYLPSDFSAPLPLNSPVKILNAYPSEAESLFSNLEFAPPSPGAPQGSSSPQTNFQPNAFSPFESNAPLLADHVFVDRAYYYLSLNGGPWSRAPRNQGEFLTPKNGFFDLEEVLAPLMNSAPSKDIHVTVDAWGWQGGALVYIGRFERIVKAKENGKPWAILPGHLEICSSGVSCGVGEVSDEFAENVISTAGGAHKLRWHLPPGIASGMWQVATQPFGNACELQPAYLYADGIVSSGEESAAFTVEFPPFTGEETIFYARVLPIVNGQPYCRLNSSPSNTATLTLKAPAEIVIATPIQPPLPPVAYDIEITNFTPIHFPDYKYQYCVTVVENPFYQSYDSALFEANPALWAWLNIAPGTNICPAPYQSKEPSLWEQVTGFLRDAVNFVADVYNTLKQFVVSLVAELNPFCLQAKLINEAANQAAGVDAMKEIEAACKAGAEIAVNIGLAYLGLPPSLPNYDELVEIGKGKLAEAIARQIEEQTGVPCSDEEIIPGQPSCQELIRKGIDAVVKEIENLHANKACMGEMEAHQNGIEPLCIPPYIKVRPMREGQLEPALMTVQLTRKADVPDSAFPNPGMYDTSCKVTILDSTTNNSWVGRQVFIGTDYQSGKSVYWQGEPINGQVFETLSVPVPSLAPGESTTLTFALQEKRGVFPPGESGFWLPGRKQIYADHYYGSQLVNYYGEAYDDWEYLYFGSQTTLTATAACTTQFITPPQGASVSGSSSFSSDKWIETIPQLGK